MNELVRLLTEWNRRKTVRTSQRQVDEQLRAVQSQLQNLEGRTDMEVVAAISKMLSAYEQFLTDLRSDFLGDVEEEIVQRAADILAAMQALNTSVLAAVDERVGNGETAAKGRDQKLADNLNALAQKSTTELRALGARLEAELKRLEAVVPPDRLQVIQLLEQNVRAELTAVREQLDSIPNPIETTVEAGDNVRVELREEGLTRVYRVAAVLPPVQSKTAKAVPPAEARNSGAGAKVYRKREGNVQFFRTLVAGENISIEQTDTEILVTAQGGGAPGRDPEFRVADGYLQWRYVGDEEWIDLVALSELALSHNGLEGLQGGTEDEYYHLSQAEHGGLTGSQDTSLHTHDGRYYTESETDTLLGGKEDVANKSTSTSLGDSDTLYPSQKAVKAYADTKAPASHDHDDRYYTESEIDTTLLGKQDSLGFTPEDSANKGVADGYASLDNGGKIPVTQLPSSVMEYKGVWSADENDPELADGEGNAGDVYRVAVGGTQNLGSGNITFDVGDYVIYNGIVWEKSDTTDAVSSVAGRVGDVTLSVSDVSGAENVANKSTDTSLGTSDTLYPSQKAVKTYVDTGLGGKQDSLGFTAENVANKSTDTALGTSDTLYPSQKAVKTYSDTKLAASSVFGQKTIVLLVTDPNGDALTTGNGKAYVTLPADMNGMDLVAVAASVTTVSSSGLPTVMVRNNTDSVNMLSTALTIDANEKTSYTAATPAVIDTNADDVVTGDEIRIDVTTAGTGAKGLQVVLTFRLP